MSRVTQIDLDNPVEKQAFTLSMILAVGIKVGFLMLVLNGISWLLGLDYGYSFGAAFAISLLISLFNLVIEVWKER